MTCPLGAQPRVSADRPESSGEKAGDYLFYAMRDGAWPEDRFPRLGANYTHVLWRPRPFAVAPRGTSVRSLGIWWLLYVLHLFRCRDYGVLVVYDGDALVHRSCIFPKWMRFPFMGRDDLQIASTWTDQRHRGQGIALWAIGQILSHHRRPGRVFWYLVHATNAPSIRVAEKAGFHFAGSGSRTSRWKCRLLGRFEITNPTHPIDATVDSPSASPGKR